MTWTPLISLGELEQVFELSNIKPVAIFKHSTRCSISAMAKSRLERQWKFDDKVPAYYLDLLEYRDVSDTLSDKTGVMHESPQFLLISKGKCVYHASHNNIDPSQIIPFII